MCRGDVTMDTVLPFSALRRHKSDFLPFLSSPLSLPHGTVEGQLVAFELSLLLLHIRREKDFL